MRGRKVETAPHAEIEKHGDSEGADLGVRGIPGFAQNAKRHGQRGSPNRPFHEASEERQVTMSAPCEKPKRPDRERLTLSF